MIDNTELAIILTMIPYTLAIVIGIHYYEAKKKNLIDELVYWSELYDEAIKIKPASIAQHYTHLQLENASLKKSVYELDLDNHTLKNQLNKAKKEILRLTPAEYESYVNPYNNPIGKND